MSECVRRMDHVVARVTLAQLRPQCGAGLSFGPNLHLILPLTSRTLTLRTWLYHTFALYGFKTSLALWNSTMWLSQLNDCHSSGVSHPNPLKFLRILLRNFETRLIYFMVVALAATPVCWREMRGLSYKNLNFAGASREHWVSGREFGGVQGSASVRSLSLCN